jgi:ABC-2 type transport system permease protein
MQMSQYRMNLAIWILSLITEPIVYMTVWTVVTREQGGSVNGLTAGQFSAYYIAWMLVRHFSVTLSPDALEWRVKNGQFSGLMLRPVHPVHIDIGENIGYKLVALPIILVMMLGLALVFPPQFTLEWWRVLVFIPAVIVSFLIRFLFHWIVGLIAFWTTRASALFDVLSVSEIFLTGRLAPMQILPPVIVTIATFSPFRWMISFPVELLLGQVAPQDVVPGLAIQLFWLAFMIGLLRVVWGAAVRRYGAVGG